jgi:anti-anti-sigma factor
MSENQVFWEAAQARLILGGDLVSSTVAETRRMMQQILKEGGKDMVVDLANVNMIDSSGIGCLVAAFNSLAKNAGKLSVINASEDIYELLQSMRLDHHFPISRSAG